ncbi:hypothetical protein K3N28_21570 [Glycomyces sp. TRM65418]|uniref:hypothetical protein n=1 Tax=Glycomyces sp. TRM65418 TaxID=2867006 RepID=UPI001CE4F25E|nr:hypothetical protein [Glycomyces sp. TRM65418]MCC3765653.1 hypothetical protein [Glycomyces sp. TRM65418]QZD55251.1 hypothetical protein K3N28_21460 [Glycomyces sp. TRM65418]
MEEPTQPADSAGPISSTVHRWRRLAVRHNLEWSELLLIALNLYGLRGNNTEGMRLRLNSEDEEFMLVLPADRATSPFSLRAHVDPSSPQHGLSELCVDGTPVAEIIEAEPGEEVRGYLRADGTAATLLLQTGIDSTELVKCYRDLLQALASDLADDGEQHVFDEVTLSAGGVHDEALVVEHLAAVREAMTGEGMPESTTLGVLTPALRSQSAFAELAAKVGPVLFFLTTETFEDDTPATEAEPSVPVDAAAADPLTPAANQQSERLSEILAAAREAGHRTSFTYTVGSEPLDEMRAWLLPLAEQTTMWPSLTILPAESPVDDSQHVAAPDERLDFFLEARRLLEQIFAPTQLRPQPWRCYRGLWYRQHAGEHLDGPYV